MKEALEREVKLSPGEGFVLPELGGHVLPTRVFVSTYHDTDDLALARHGITLRHRVEKGAGAWQLKLPRGAAAYRARAARPACAAAARALVAALRPPPRRRDLAPVARLRTRREGVLADGAEIVDDSVVRDRRAAGHAALPGDRGRARRAATSARCGGSRKSFAARAPHASEELRPKLYRALDLALPAPPAIRASGNAAGRCARARARRAGEAPPAARPGRPPRLRPRGSPPASCGDPPSARVPPRGAGPPRPVVVGAATRRARLAGRARSARRAISTC